jgi:hypothetical protein
VPWGVLTTIQLAVPAYLCRVVFGFAGRDGPNCG